MEYAQIVSYMPPTQAAKFESDTFCQSSLPSFFRPAYHLPQPWNQEKGNGRLTEDFILIAEFSELEGPKPLVMCLFIHVCVVVYSLWLSLCCASFLKRHVTQAG